jgi:hypothetical protein
MAARDVHGVDPPWRDGFERLMPVRPVPQDVGDIGHAAI